MTNRRWWLLPCALVLAAAFPSFAYAAGSGMPWEGPLQQILDSITGPVVRFGAIVAIVLVGVALAFSEGGGIMRRLIGIVFGLSIAFAAITWGLDFFGFSGGASL